MAQTLDGSGGSPGLVTTRAAGGLSARATVLVIDDDEPEAEGLRAALAGQGYEVGVVRSGADAVQLVRNRRFDLAVLDVDIVGELDGVATLAALKQIDEAMGIVLAAPEGSVERAIACLRHGAWDYVRRPTRLDELTLHLDRALEHRKLQAAVELYEASHALLTSLSSDELRGHVLDMARKTLRCPTAVLLLHMAGGDASWEIHVQGPDTAEATVVAQRLFVEGNLATNAPWSGRIGERPEAALLPRSFDRVVAYPLVVRDHCLGLLVAMRRVGMPGFTDLEDQRGALFSAQAALALDNARIYAALESIAVIDELTGVHSRRYLFDIVRRSRPETATAGTSFLMIDVDHFKNVNDEHGHAVGDRVLRRVADLLVTATRDTDVVARVGGEEFAVLLPHTDEETATDVAERVRATIALHTQSPQVTVSVGVASLPGALFAEGEDPLERAARLMEQADVALYRAKRAGRNRVCVWRARQRERIGPTVS